MLHYTWIRYMKHTHTHTGNRWIQITAPSTSSFIWRIWYLNILPHIHRHHYRLDKWWGYLVAMLHSIGTNQGVTKTAATKVNFTISSAAEYNGSLLIEIKVTLFLLKLLSSNFIRLTSKTSNFFGFFLIVFLFSL